MTINEKISDFCESCSHFKMFFYKVNGKNIPKCYGECHKNPPILVDKETSLNTGETIYTFDFPTVSTFKGYCSRFKR